jgi:HEAT repeat protein
MDVRDTRMRTRKFIELRLLVGVTALATALAASDARSDAPRPVTPDSDAAGFAAVYGTLPQDQVEFLSTPAAIKSAAASGAPSLVWEVLEHGEKVECLTCIGAVAPLLYDANAKTREIAAWWLRRRILGVFGPGEVYQQTVQTLQSDPNATRRADAAYALGEFFATPGIAACAVALSDSSAIVRAAAASALGRLNSDGNGALATAFGDSDPSVKLAALAAASRINAFSGVSKLAALTMDPDSAVRRRAVEVIDALQVFDAVAIVTMVAQTDADPGVRAAACHALGSIGAASLVPILQSIVRTDSNGFVRDQAQIALLRI